MSSTCAGRKQSVFEFSGASSTFELRGGKSFAPHLWAALVVALAWVCRAAPLPAASKVPVPDLTQGGQPDDKHDWNLGPTGARGWIWGWNLETTDARQILVTRVAPGSPAAGVLQPGDVILGIDGRMFSDDARKAFARAITRAEQPENGGRLRLLAWRNGRRADLELRLPVMGRYAPMAPYGCAKSARILEAGCRHIAAHMKGGIDGKINTLALLASGKPEYLPLVRDYVRALAPPELKLKLHSSSGMASWHWGYTNLLLAEYYLATGDRYVLPALREYSVNIARGQSSVGTWGHGMAWPDINQGRLHGRLGGYGALNQAGLVCHLSLVLAAKCGVQDVEVQRAIQRANLFFGFYVDKGAIPYGDHRPGWHVHDDNGKNSIAAITFDLQAQHRATEFFSRMTVASYAERERGHTGNYFSFLWGALGAARAGPEAAAAYLRELQWYYDLARSHDGSFPYQGGAGMGGGEHKYANWDCTGAFLLAYALPKRVLYITGKGTHVENRLTGDELAEVIEAGRGFSSWHMGVEPYRARSTEELFQCLRSWSPAVRHRAAVALAERSGEFVPRLLLMLDSDDRYARYGACQALGALGERAGPAVPALTDTLADDDLWVRILASYALADIGAPARTAVPDLLKLAASPDPDDPRQMLQRYLAFGLFYPGGALRMVGLLAHNLEGVDRQLLYPAVEQLLRNPDGRARGAVGSVFDQLDYEEIKPLLPAILEAIEEPAPSGVMFASGIRLRGLEVLARYRIKEGMPLCLQVMEIDRWGKRHRIGRCLQILQSYGAAAKCMLPELRRLEQQLQNHREARNLGPEIEKVRKTIAAIEAAHDTLPLRSLEQIGLGR